MRHKRMFLPIAIAVCVGAIVVCNAAEASTEGNGPVWDVTYEFPESTSVWECWVAGTFECIDTWAPWDTARFNFGHDPYTHDPYNLEVVSATLTLNGYHCTYPDDNAGAMVRWQWPDQTWEDIGYVPVPGGPLNVSFPLAPDSINGNNGIVELEFVGGKCGCTGDWCDCVHLDSVELHVEHTPELPPSALLGLSTLPLGLAYIRGRRRTGVGASRRPD